MSPALFLALALAAAAEPARCFTPTDQSAGWKQVTLPDGVAGLAAPEGIDQFRPGEPARVFESDPRAYLGGSPRGLGRTQFEFSAPRDARRLELEFSYPLRGAKVDAVAYAGGRTFPLVAERRVAGSSLRIDWDLPEVDTVTVTVHDHFRQQPVVKSWRIERLTTLLDDPGLPSAFKLGRSLYFRHPGGRRIELCEAPGRTPELERRSIDASALPVSVTLAPR
ncbi:MAG: hypothetical protein ACYC8T_18525 [Myxococcaceae bacterium]